MSKKPTFIIKFKYPEGPWREWARTQVPKMVDHYKDGARVEEPGADIKVFKD